MPSPAAATSERLVSAHAALPPVLLLQAASPLLHGCCAAADLQAAPAPGCPPWILDHCPRHMGARVLHPAQVRLQAHVAVSSSGCAAGLPPEYLEHMMQVG
jgi:hypothetical protein